MRTGFHTLPRSVDEAVVDERITAQEFRYLFWINRFEHEPKLDHQARYWRVSSRTLRRWRESIRACGYTVRADTPRPVADIQCPINGHPVSDRTSSVRNQTPLASPPSPSLAPPVIEAPVGGVSYIPPSYPSPSTASLTPPRAAAAAGQCRESDTEGNGGPKPEPLRLDLFQFLDMAESCGFGNLKLLHGEFISSANREALMLLLRARPEHLRQAFDALLQLPVEKRPRTARFWLRVLTERVGAMDAPALSVPDKPFPSKHSRTPDQQKRLLQLRDILDDLDEQQRLKRINPDEGERRRAPLLQEFDELLQESP